MANLRYGDALAESEEIGFSLSSSFEDSLERALHELSQYENDAEAQTFEEVEEELVYEFDELDGLWDEHSDG